MLRAIAYLMENKIQNYEWGTKGNDAIIPKLLDIKVDENIPCAELWMGAHKKASSCLVIDNKSYPLIDLIEKYPKEVLGDFVIQNFDGNFPFLLKVLSACESLSIQVHPNKEKAKFLHAKDPKNYPDDNHKPEIAIAITELTALAGFKSIPEICDLLTEHPSILTLTENISLKDLENMRNKKKEVQEKFLKDIYSGINYSNENNLISTLQKVKEKIQSKEIKNEQEKLFLELEEKYKNDAGLLSVLILKLKKLQKGEAIFLEAGIPHAYIKGDIIECMANSDNVIRAGLTPKFKDIPALIETVDYAIKEIEIIDTELIAEEKIYKTKAKEFEVSFLELNENENLSFETFSKPGIIFLLEGSVSLRSEKENFEMEIKKGNSVFIPALLSKYEINSSKNSVIVKASIPNV